MKKLINLFVSIFSFLLIGLIIFICFYRLTTHHYNDKFKNLEIGTHIKELKKKWGKPDYEGACVNCSGNILLKYNKDIIDWDTYIFIINPKDSLLISKNIDD